MTSNGTWLELSVECDNEAVESVSELFARYGFNNGVVIEEPFTQDPDGDNLKVDLSRPVTVRTFLAKIDAKDEDIELIRGALWHLGQMRHVGALGVTEREEEDWANAWKAHYTVHRIGNKTSVRAPWHEDDPIDGTVMIELDPGMAFGTGLHPTTRLCMLALESALEPGMRVLDVGTGSGILAIAAVKLGAASVDATDIEPVAVRSAIENAERNAVAGQIRTELAASVEESPFHDQYDLVMANIIARILIDLCPGLVSAVRPGGTLVLSGIIEPREEALREAFESRGMVLQQREQIEDWVAIVYRKPADA